MQTTYDLWHAEQWDDYIALCEEVGKPPLKSFKGSFNVRLTPELHRKAFISAAAQHISLNAFVESAISDKLSEAANR